MTSLLPWAGGRRAAERVRRGLEPDGTGPRRTRARPPEDRVAGSPLPTSPRRGRVPRRSAARSAASKPRWLRVCPRGRRHPLGDRRESTRAVPANRSRRAGGDRHVVPGAVVLAGRRARARSPLRSARVAEAVESCNDPCPDAVRRQARRLSTMPDRPSRQSCSKQAGSAIRTAVAFAVRRSAARRNAPAPLTWLAARAGVGRELA